MSDDKSHEVEPAGVPDGDKLGGILEQTRGDIDQGNVSDVADALRQRIADAGITVTDAEFEALLASLT